MRHAVRSLAMLAALAALAPFASAYYFFIYFAGNGAPFIPVPLKFDLNAADTYGIQNNTATYLIQSQGPSVFMQGDTFPAVISTIRAAANAWNAVNTCGLKLAFGGLSDMTMPETTPGIDVVFDTDTVPGLLAYTVVSTVSNPGAYLANGATSLPIVNSTMHLYSDLAANQQSSYSDAFFLTIVHEFGHTLGLQHTLTSSVMSTQITSATTKAAPLATDDTVGVSLLYPANGFPAGTGSVTGTVTLAGNGVNLASVVALSLTGVAVSGLTNPDGTYRIDGIPPGQYYVYAHPLPPPALGEAYPDNICPPNTFCSSGDGSPNPFPANTAFGTQFFGGTTDWTQAAQVTVSAGASSDGVNFSVPARSGPAISMMTTYGYPGAGNVAVSQPPIQNYGWLVFTANGVVVNGNQVAPGLSLSVMGGAAYLVPSRLAYYETVLQPPNPPEPFLEIEVVPNPVAVQTPVALVATLNNDVYVLPSAFSVVPSAAPSISAVNGITDAQGNTTVNITGTNLGPATRILFDGSPALSVAANADGSLTVAAPPAAAGYRASVEALSATDNQTSWQTLSAPPLTFTYGGPAYPSVSVSPSTVAAGTDAMVTISGYSTDFVNAQMAVGFGSSDIVVKHVWVISPGLAMANLSVNPAAPAQTTTLSVASGLQLADSDGGVPDRAVECAAHDAARAGAQSGHRTRRRAGGWSRIDQHQRCGGKSDRLDPHHR